MRIDTGKRFTFGTCFFVRQHTDMRVWLHKQWTFDKLDHCGESYQHGLLAPYRKEGET